MSKLILPRRSFLRGLFAAPAIIAVDRLMPVKSMLWPGPGFKLIENKYGREFYGASLSDMITNIAPTETPFMRLNVQTWMLETKSSRPPS